MHILCNLLIRLTIELVGSPEIPNWLTSELQSFRHMNNPYKKNI